MNDDIKTLQEKLKILQEKFSDIEKANKKLNQRLTEADALYSITSTLNSSLDISKILKIVKIIFTQTFKMDQYSLMLFEEDSNILSIKSCHGLSHEWAKISDFNQENTIFNQAVENKKSIYIKKTSDINNEFILDPLITKENGSFLCIPLINENDEVLGVLNLFRTGKNIFRRQDIELFEKIAEQIALALDKTLLFEHTKELSITDELTGIFNRRYFNQRYDREIQRSKRYQHSLSVLMLDIDHFKRYNDLSGHIKGDEVLKKIATILEANIRKADILARFGGEEFVILLPEISKNQARKVANKLRRIVEDAEFENEQSLPGGQITVSLGLAVYPEDSKEAPQLIQYADKALYLAKTMGRNCVAWHGMKAPGSKKRVSKEHSVKVAEKSL